MRIAFMGSRGVPASYSGFETFVEQLGSRLAARGHDVFVYNRTTHVPLTDRTYRGMRIIPLPTIPSKHLDTIVHTLLSMLHGAFMGYDIVYICGVGSAVLSFIPRLYGARVIENPDGADWTRKKWGGFARWFLRLSERFVTIFPHAVIADSAAVRRYYAERYGTESVLIPYGADLPAPEGDEALRTFGLRRRGYILFVGRLVPENNAHMIIEAYRGLATDLTLVIVGDNPYDRPYVSRLKDMAQGDPKIVFTGYVFGQCYRQLSSNAWLFVLAAEVGGTHPVLLEAMALGNCVLVNDTEANLEVVGDAGVSFSGRGGAAALRERIRGLLSHPGDVEALREKAVRRVRERYSWEVVTEDYIRLFQSLVGG